MEKKESGQKDSGLSNKERKEKEKEWKRMKNAMSSLEQKIEEKEVEIETLEKDMADPSKARENQEIFFQHAELQRKLEEYMQRWEKTGEEFSALSELLDR